MSSGNDEAEKTLDPSPKKLAEARRKGDVPKSTDLLVSAAYAGLVIALLGLGEQSVRAFGTVMSSLVDRAGTISQVMFDAPSPSPLGAILWAAALPIMPIFAVPALAVVLCMIAQRALVIAPEKLRPKLSRISVISNAKNKFGRAGLFEFAKSALKLVVYSACLGLFLQFHAETIIGAMQAGGMAAIALMAQLAVQFMVIAALIAGLVGAVDLLFQHSEHIRKNRMSYKELQDEIKSDEGDPHLKAERRQRALRIANNQMLRDVAGADVVVVNPTHYAVALRWDRAPGRAPVCVAKGVGEIALAIRNRAEEARVPIRSDPPTARALFAGVEIGEEIAPEHYGPIAAAIRFAEDMRRKMRAGR